MRILLTLILLPALANAAQPQGLAKPCHPEPQMAKGRQSPRIRPLNEMPPAKQVLGVYREVNGCTEPVVVREQVGVPARR